MRKAYHTRKALPRYNMTTRPHFLSLTEEQLKAEIVKLGEPSFRAAQVWQWIYVHKQNDPSQMSNLSKSLQSKLADSFNWSLPTIKTRLDSADQASKLLLLTDQQQMIETVILRYEGRVSVCVSSQVGCRLACTFCQTGKLGFFRHLTQGEILGQYYIAQQILLREEEGRRLSHVVFMGMGEPLDNAAEVLPAVNKLIDPNGFGLSAKNVTISSSGIVPEIETLANKTRASLAISLHAPTDELRSELMPINRRYNLAQLKAAMKKYQHESGNIVTIEYIMIKNKNCSLTQAKQLVSYLHGLKAKINLIPFNPHPGLPFQKPDAEEIRSFQKHLSDRGYPSPVRYSRGLEVSGGCGQLAAKTSEALHDAPKRKNVVAEQMSL
ncbi:MAG: 23S rRNA (adenine(2503)-C(2))-methyltransferase RlmN [Oligoflexales bacterium]|nr:23S rRNA (adenine(2503)-C(2))-methyltransferase RlmN [Oligoflexales bacterium]